SGRPDSALVTNAALPDKKAAQNKAVQRRTKRQSQPLTGLRRRFQATHTSHARILAAKVLKQKGRSVEILRLHHDLVEVPMGKARPIDDPHVQEIMHTRDPQSGPPCQRVREEPASYSQRENYSLSGKHKGSLPSRWSVQSPWPRGACPCGHRSRPSKPSNA